MFLLSHYQFALPGHGAGLEGTRTEEDRGREAGEKQWLVLVYWRRHLNVFTLCRSTLTSTAAQEKKPNPNLEKIGKLERKKYCIKKAGKGICTSQRKNTNSPLQLLAALRDWSETGNGREKPTAMIGQLNCLATAPDCVPSCSNLSHYRCFSEE